MIESAVTNADSYLIYVVNSDNSVEGPTSETSTPAASKYERIVKKTPAFRRFEPKIAALRICGIIASLASKSHTPPIVFE